MRNTTNNDTWITKIIACIVVFCFGAAIILAAIHFLGMSNKISELEKKIDNKTLTSADVTAYAEAEGITRDEVLSIVATYIADNKLDYSQFCTRNEVAEMIASAISAYDRTRFDENGHCLCCEGGEHVATQYIDRTQTIDNTKTEYIDRTKTEIIDNSTHTTEYVENPFDASGYYTREEVDALIREALASQVNNTIPETDPEDQNTVVSFIEADPGFQGEVGGESTVTDPGEGEQGVAASENPSFVDPSEGFQGNVDGETTVTDPSDGEQGTATSENPGFVDPSEGSQGTATEENPGFVDPSAGEQGTVGNTETPENTDAPTGQTIDLRSNPDNGSQGTANDDSSNGSFNGPSEGFEGSTDGNVGDGFNSPAAGEQGTANTENSENSNPDAGFENGAPSGQTIDLRGLANSEPVGEITDPGVGFSGVENTETTETVDGGFIMPGEGVGFGG